MSVRATQSGVGESIVLVNVSIKDIRLANILNVLRVEREHIKHKVHYVIQKAKSIFAINHVSQFGKILIY